MIVASPSSWRRPSCHRQLGFNSSNPSPKAKKVHTEWCGPFWQRMRDSNPRKRSQSPVCYRYTNPLCARHGLYYIQSQEKVKHYFPFSPIIFTWTPSPGCPHKQLFPKRKNYSAGFKTAKDWLGNCTSLPQIRQSPKAYRISYLPSSFKFSPSLPGFTAQIMPPRL